LLGKSDQTLHQSIPYRVSKSISLNPILQVISCRPVLLPAMASPKSVLSQTLQNITLSKIRELESRHKSYEDRKTAFLAEAQAASNEQDRLSSLLKAVKELCPSASKDDSLKNIERWRDQSLYDASIPESTLADFSRQLTTMLDVQSCRFNMAHLYSRILTGMEGHGSLCVLHKY
jgi:hypothetical protein